VLNRIGVVDTASPRPNKPAYLSGKQKLDTVDNRALAFPVRAKQNKALPLELNIAVRQTAKMLKPNRTNHLTHGAPPVELGLPS
jgi:hypothetical protein